MTNSAVPITAPEKAAMHSNNAVLASFSCNKHSSSVAQLVTLFEMLPSRFEWSCFITCLLDLEILRVRVLAIQSDCYKTETPQLLSSADGRIGHYLGWTTPWCCLCLCRHLIDIVIPA